MIFGQFFGHLRLPDHLMNRKAKDFLRIMTAVTENGISVLKTFEKKSDI